MSDIMEDMREYLDFKEATRGLRKEVEGLRRQVGLLQKQLEASEKTVRNQQLLMQEKDLSISYLQSLVRVR